MQRSSAAVRKAGMRAITVRTLVACRVRQSVCEHAQSFQGKTASIRRQINSKKGARRRPFEVS